MVYKLNTNNKDHISIKFWYLEWEKYVQNKNYSSAITIWEELNIESEVTRVMMNQAHERE